MIHSLFGENGRKVGKVYLTDSLGLKRREIAHYTGQHHFCRSKDDMQTSFFCGAGLSGLTGTLFALAAHGTIGAISTEGTVWGSIFTAILGLPTLLGLFSLYSATDYALIRRAKPKSTCVAIMDDARWAALEKAFKVGNGQRAWARLQAELGHKTELTEELDLLVSGYIYQGEPLVNLLNGDDLLEDERAQLNDRIAQLAQQTAQSIRKMIDDFDAPRLEREALERKQLEIEAAGIQAQQAFLQTNHRQTVAMQVQAALQETDFLIER